VKEEPQSILNEAKLLYETIGIFISEQQYRGEVRQNIMDFMKYLTKQPVGRQSNSMEQDKLRVGHSVKNIFRILTRGFVITRPSACRHILL
jgi:hypothetical protein